jgi:hypothetical protein
MGFNIYDEKQVVRKISFTLMMSQMIALEDPIINIKKMKCKTLDWINIQGVS